MWCIDLFWLNILELDVEEVLVKFHKHTLGFAISTYMYFKQFFKEIFHKQTSNFSVLNSAYIDF